MVIGLAPAQAGLAAIYKWIDAEGNVVYSQTQPPGGRPAEEVKQRNYGQSEAAKNTAKQAEREDRIEKNCETARANLSLLETQAKVTLKDADGNAYVLEEVEKQEKILEAQSAIERYCN